jgi:predicted RNA-binding protein
MKPNNPQTTPRYWIGVVSKNHVARGVVGGLAQLGHGKRAPLARMKAGDWLIYYSPKIAMDGDEPCQAFTAIGVVKTGEIYEGNMGGGFVPNRLDVDYQQCVDAPIRPLIEKLAFIEDPKRWGYKFRFGHFEIGEADFLLIAAAMGVAKF